MAIDVWEPQKPLSIDEALLQELAEVSRSGEALNDLNSGRSEGSKSKPVGTSINNANDSETSTV